MRAEKGLQGEDLLCSLEAAVMASSHSNLNASTQQASQTTVARRIRGAGVSRGQVAASDSLQEMPKSLSRKIHNAVAEGWWATNA